MSLTREEMEVIVAETTTKVLNNFGFDAKDARELRADLAHLRSWRQSTDIIKVMTIRTAVTVFVTGFLGIIWIAIETYMRAR